MTGRGSVAGLATPHPIADTLPEILLGDGTFVRRLCTAFDDALAPVFATLNSFAAYLDPATTPEDMLGWLGGWIGLAVDESRPPEQQRALVRSGRELLSRRGTTRGIREAVELFFATDPDAVVEVVESGGAAWSATPGAPLPGTAPARLVVRLRVPDPGAVDTRRLDALVGAVKPAHVAHRVEVYRID